MSNSKAVAVKSTSGALQGKPEDLLIPPDRPFIPYLPSDGLIQSPPQSLPEYREIEGRDHRKRRLLRIWQSLPDILKQSPMPHSASVKNRDGCHITFEKVESLKATYDRELLLLCKILASADSREPHVGWNEFKIYAEAKEAELWCMFHDELDLDGNGLLDHKELHSALSRAGIELSASTVSEFITSLSTEPHSSQITFRDFRDFFILLPRKVSPAEIYQYYEVKKYIGDDGRGPARVYVEGDISLSAGNKPPDSGPFIAVPKQPHVSKELNHEYAHGEEEEEEEGHHFLEGHTALKFLLAGGVAGAVSRSCTAPFDRLKIFLITRPPELGGLSTANAKIAGVKTITNAVAQIYSEGGLLAFWTGNGLSVAKIFPESAIKFFAYESSKRAFAKYWDKVEDSRDISGISRFLSGGIGGISSQLSIYPIETLKTQMMSSTGSQKRSLVAAVRHLWAVGGLHAYYRGLSIGLVGVFPYSAIDMSTFEALKLAYQRSTGKQEPGVLALLAFGSISGSVGATSVYPLNLVRTRLQASGSSGHPQIYTGVRDVAAKTWEREGWKGFYRGLFPTLAKVVPAVSISYVVYEHAKRRLGV
ncbi:mitochondrial carrier [Phlegmacium glaucopus]|nr:mitochondrial carrier [Phlegmacium glaucopus]